ncbi:hypothetical protein DB345_02810 [Spartobacteria bacterium LR76]|nr:hypothetical protein DB345_02810 [Spartobacteria bacterium LR76]
MNHIKLIESQSGLLSAELASDIGYDEVPVYAEKVLKYLHGNVVSRNVLPDAQLWQVKIDGISLELVYEDFPQMVSLEATSKEGNDLLRNLLPTLWGLIKDIRLA